MLAKTSRRLQACTDRDFKVGNRIVYGTPEEHKYWASQGWIRKSGKNYVLTTEGRYVALKADK